MSDYLNDDDDLDGNDAPQAQNRSNDQDDEPGWRRRLKTDRDNARKERDDLKREVAFLKAGINPDDPKAKYFVKGYDGDLTADAIKAEAQTLGLVAAADGEDADDIPADERRAHERMTQTTTGARSPSGADAFTHAIAEAKAAGQHQRVIELRQQQAAYVRAQQK